MNLTPPAIPPLLTAAGLVGALLVLVACGSPVSGPSGVPGSAVTLGSGVPGSGVPSSGGVVTPGVPSLSAGQSADGRMDYPPGTYPYPNLPEGMKENTVEGAKLFIGYFAQHYNYGQNHGYGDFLRSLSHPECRYCNKTITDFDKQGKDKQKSRGGLLVIDIHEVEYFERIDMYLATVTVHISAQEIRNADSTRFGKWKASSLPVKMIFEPNNGNWRMINAGTDKERTK